MPLQIKKHESETWREAVIRQSSRFGLEQEVLDLFDEAIEAGSDEDEAAFHACYEWDALDFVPEKDF